MTSTASREQAVTNSPDRPVAMISSTARDLPLHRKEVMDACLQQGLFPRMMEHLPASDNDAIKASLDMVDDARIYLGVFAHRYGHVPKGHKISITEMEYQRAVERQIPRLIFLMHDDHSVRAADVETGAGAKKLQALKKRLDQEKVVAFFKSPEDLRGHVLHSLIEFRPSASGVATDPQLGQERAEYLQRLAEACRWIDLGGLAPQIGGELLRLPLDAVFIHLHAERDVPLMEEYARAEFLLRNELEERGASPDEVARRMDRLAAKGLKAAGLWEAARKERLEVVGVLKHPRAVVLGDPGSGKTTLLRHIARSLALRHPQMARLFEADVLPVPIRLGEYDQYCARQGRVSLMEFAPIAARTRGLPLSDELLGAEVTQGRCLILLDGLDEIVHAGHRTEIRDRIEELARHYPKVRIVVTSRIVGYRDAQLPQGEDGFAHFTLSPFDDEEIAHFATLWYEAIRATGDLADPARRNAEVLVQGIRSLPGVRRLATNPLLMTLIALIYWREVRLPRRRIELYAGAARTLLSKWVQTRTPDVCLSEREAASLLMAVAFHMHQTSSTGLISRPELERVLVRLKTDPERSGLPEIEAETEAAEFLGTQGQHVGLLYPRGFNDRNQEVYGFLHLTFEEYFAGRELARLWKQGKLKLPPFLHRPRWEEPILLACAHLSDEDDERSPNDFVQEILDAGSPYEKELHRDLLLAARCLADDVIVSRDLAQRIMDGLDEAFSTSIFPLIEQIRDLFSSMRGSRSEPDAVRLLLQKLDAESQSVRRAAAEILGGLGEAAARPGVLSTLLDRLRDDNADVRYEAASALGGLGEAAARPEVLFALLDRLRDVNANVRSAATRALGGLGAAAARPEVLSALLERLRNDDAKVRAEAAWALGGLGEAAARPEVFFALLERLRDDDEDVHDAAWWVLSDLGEAGVRPEVFSALLERLRDDEANVRAEAARALGFLCEAVVRPEVLSALLERLRDGDANVRAEAAGALGGLGEAARSEVLSALLERLHDEEVNVRSAAAGALGRRDEAARPEVLFALLERLRDDDADVRSAAAGALGRRDEAARPEVLSALLDRLRDDDDAYVRDAAAVALGGLGEAAARPEVLSALLDRLRDDDDDVRYAAAGALGRLGEAAARPEVLSALLDRLRDDDDANVRYAAAGALGDLGEAAARPEVLSALLDRLRDDDDDVRFAAAGALGRLGEAAAEKPILDRLAETIYSPEARGMGLEGAAFRALSQLVQFYQPR